MKEEIEPDSFHRKMLSILELKERSIRLRELARLLLELSRKMKAQPMPWELKARTMESLERAANNLTLAGAEINRGAEKIAEGEQKFKRKREPYRPDALVSYEEQENREQEKIQAQEKPTGSQKGAS